MSQKSSKLEADEQRLVEYLNSFDGKTSFPRRTCCNSSRSLYCKECCRLLVPDDVLPDPISLRREVKDTGVLDDRRCSATGLHAVALLNSGEENHKSADDLGSVTLIDVANGDDIPNYDYNSIDPIEQSETAFLLFPSPGESVPIDSVAHQMETLVVLDCKWTKSSLCRKNANLMKLRKVHLSNTYNTHYWRWHNAGDGCVSTIEAIYYAAMEVSEQKYKQLLSSEDQCTFTLQDHLADQSNLMHLLWLFGHQRAATFQAANRDGKPAPGSAEAKELARALRKQSGEYAWRSERNKEIGKILKEECRRMKELGLKKKH
ncbi:DTW domain-containing protein [Skeletonema marinoi]|uniref:tRNA-uridine aminocarboxypropyltransferase 1 n=1 Tax=Skeletonema marinoi TaxID=267567 RepID=A0AAD9D8J9_9STRA|nr:DTW domain-containing protein [Skeletonema marinoi]